MRDLSHLITHQIWKGEPCVIAGGGASLRTFDWKNLGRRRWCGRSGRWEGWRWIGCNWAYLFDPPLCFCMDHTFLDAVSGREDWKTSRCVKVIHGGLLTPEMEQSLPARWPGVYRARSAGADTWGRDLDQGIYLASNAGLAAINLAEILGADPIYLLGFDLEPGSWHDHRAPKSPDREEERCRIWRDEFQRAVGWISSQVVNLNPESRLTVFPRKSPEEIFDAR